MKLRTWIIPSTHSKLKLTLTWLYYYSLILSHLLLSITNPSSGVLYYQLLSLLTSTFYHTTSTNTLSTANQSFIKPKLSYAGKHRWDRFYSPTPTKIFNIKFSSPDNLVNIFYHSLRFTTSSWIRNFKTHASFRLLFTTYRFGANTPVNLDGSFRRWKHSYLFLFNLFYSESTLPTFGSRIFKNEILSLNWSFNLLNYQLFKFASPFFIFNDESYGDKSFTVLKKWKRQSINHVFLLELKILKKLTYFFKTLGTFIIGIVPMNSNPWLVSYPIPALGDNKLIQYYFLKLITFIRQDAIKVKFTNSLLVWANCK